MILCVEEKHVGIETLERLKNEPFLPQRRQKEDDLREEMTCNTRESQGHVICSCADDECKMPHFFLTDKLDHASLSMIQMPLI